MNKEFKKIILKLAGLSCANQKWVLNQLTAKEQKQFKNLHGDTLLNDAYRFRKLPYAQLPDTTNTSHLPDFCQELMQQDPLYISIILEQGQFSWEQQFIQRWSEVNQQINHIKPATKLCVFQQWQAQLSFCDHLEMETCNGQNI